jgi:hypothetical protein
MNNSFTSQAGNPQLYAANIGNNLGQFNITLWVRDWKNETDLGNLNVTIYDLEEKIWSSYLSNETGQIDLFFLDSGTYVTLVQDGHRTVGYQKINVAENATHVIGTWSYDLNITLVDENGNPLANQTVFLYDQTVFHAPNYTITADTVKRLKNFTVVTDEVGSLIGQAETDENGTLSFTGVWNGTYRLGVLGKEEWVEEYILGELVLILQEPAVGEHVISLQEPANITLTCIRVDLGLQFVSTSNVPVSNLSIYTRNAQGHLYFKDKTNSTGFVEHKNLYVIDGVHAVSARYGNRTVGHRIIEVTKTENFTIECWTNNITITCVDRDGNPLTDHPVLLYDQLVVHSPTNITTVTNQTGLIVNYTRTDENGTAYFNDVWNGTYWIEVRGGETIGKATISLQKAESLTILCDKTDMSLRFVAHSGEPLAGAIVSVYNVENNLVFRGHTSQDGSIFREGMYLGTYTVSVKYNGVEVWAGTVDIYQEKGKTIECAVYRLTLRFLDPFGNSLPKAEVTITKKEPFSHGAYFIEVFVSETDETGGISLLLPPDTYIVSCSSGIFSALKNIALDSGYEMDVGCNVKIIFWLLMLVVTVPLLLFTLLFERRKLRTPLEIRRYKSMLSELESMYGNGLVEYKVYRKLREEYEAKVLELGGREMR